MPSAVEYFEKLASARLDNYLQGGTGYGAGADLAAHEGHMSLDELPHEQLRDSRERARSLEAIGSIGLGSLGAVGLAEYEHPGQLFDSWEHTKDTAENAATGSSLGIIGGMAPSAIHGHSDTAKLIQEAKRRRAVGDQAPDLASTTIGHNHNPTEASTGVAGDVAPANSM